MNNQLLSIDGLRPYAKFVTPAVLGILAAVIHGLVEGSWRTTELEITLTAFIASTLAFVVQNGPTGWRKYAKAIVPAVLAVCAVVIHWLVTSEWNASEWSIAIAGLGSAVVTFLVPNTHVGSITVNIPGVAPVTSTPVDPAHVGDVADDDLPSDEEEFNSPPPLEGDEIIPGTNAPSAGHKPDPGKLP